MLTPTSVGPTIQHDFYDYNFGDDIQYFAFDAPFVQLVNYDTIQVNVSAPAGKAWRVSYANQGFSSATLTYQLLYNNSFNSPYVPITSGNLKFDFVNSGDASLQNYFNNTVMPNGGDRLFLQMGDSVINDFEFTAFTATVTYDNAALDPAYLSYYFGSQLGLGYSPSDPNATDPGPEMTLVDVPEPSSLTLFGACALALVLGYRHRKTA